MKNILVSIFTAVSAGVLPVLSQTTMASQYASAADDEQVSSSRHADDRRAHPAADPEGTGERAGRQNAKTRGQRVIRLADATAVSAPNASADGSESAGIALQEVMVTAQKYQQRAFDVPISMSVIGGPELKTLGGTALEDLQFYVPGMYVDNLGNALVVTIQGMSNVFGQGALVGTYLDEADVTSEVEEGLDLNAYDLERVEVLKGPQGTLYGQGSEGGTIRYITNKPVLDRSEFGADVALLFDQYGAPEERLQAVVNTPIVGDKLGLRIAADLDSGGGWIDQPAANQKNINSKNLADVRIEGRWKPLQNFTMDATEVIHRNTYGGYVGETQLGVYTQAFNLTTTPSVQDNYNISNVTLHWDPGVVSVVNSSTYFRHFINESNFGGSLEILPPPLPRLDDYFTREPTIDESFSDELRISGGAVGGWRWMLGAFFKRLDDSTPLSLIYFDIPGPPGSPLPEPFPNYSDVYSNSKSLFGDTSYTLFGKLVAGVGARYFRDDESAFIIGDTEEERARFTSVDPRFYLRYMVSSEVNVYASAAKGFRSGGFNGLGFPQFQPEHVWNYAVGTKMRLLDGSLSLDSDLFLSNYGGYQIAGIAADLPIGVTRNAGDARIKGIETQVAWIPASEWRLGISGDYINGRFVKIAVLDSSHEVGDPLDDVPRYQVAAWTERDFSWEGRAAFARIDYTQRAFATFRNLTIGPWYYSQSDYMYLLGLHGGLDWSSNIKFGVFVQNLLNDRGYLGTDVIERHAVREQPRTFGVNFSVRFE